jgi:hypothetical protein
MQSSAYRYDSEPWRVSSEPDGFFYLSSLFGWFG